MPPSWGVWVTTAALHPYYASGWNRDQVYPDLGFEDTYFRDDFTNASTLRGYVDDRSAFEKLIELYEDKEENERLFAFEVTMQNHGGYSKEYPTWNWRSCSPIFRRNRREPRSTPQRSI